MSKARQLADLGNVYDDGALSNRNMVINGGMTVAQRSTSETGVGDGTVGYLTVDRFRFQKAGSPTARYTMTQNSDSPDGFSNSLKLEVTTADTSVGANVIQYIDQFIEAQDLQHLAWDTSSSGKSVTLSFYVKCSTAQTFGIDFTNEDNSRYYNTTYTISATNTWEKKTITLPADASNGFNDDNGRGLRIRWSLAAGSDFTDGSVSTAWSGTGHVATNHENTWIGATGRTWQLTGVQLEIGDTATPFEHRSYGDELARCQRYYQKTGTGVAYAPVLSIGYANTSTSLITYTTLPIPMRATPTLSSSGSFQTTQISTTVISGVSLGDSNNVCVRVDFSSSGMTTATPYGIRNANDTSAYIAFDAEL